MNSQTINSLLQEKRPILERLAFKFTNDPFEIDDLVQETLIKSLKQIESLMYDPKLLSWLFVIMKNIYINNYRKKQRIKSYENTNTLFESQAVTKNKAESNFIVDDIHKVLRNLKQSKYECMLMYIRGYTYQEIAEKMNTPEGTIKTRIHYCKKLLEKKLKQYRLS